MGTGVEYKGKTLIPDANLFKEAFEKGQATNASLSSGSAPAEESFSSAPAETAPEPVNVCPLSPLPSFCFSILFLYQETQFSM